MSGSSPFRNKPRPRHTRRVSWDPALDRPSTQEASRQPSPVPPHPSFPYEAAAQIDRTRPHPTFSWPRRDDFVYLYDSSESEDETKGESEDEEAQFWFGTRNIRKKDCQSFRVKNVFVTNNPSTAPAGWKRLEDKGKIPHLHPVPLTARRDVIEPPPRTDGGFTPHPSVGRSFRKQMDRSLSFGAYDNPSRKTDSRFSNNRGGHSNVVIPDLTPHHGIIQPWVGSNEVVGGSVEFKTYDVVYVPVWSYSRNVFIWTKGCILQSVGRLGPNSTGDRCYKVCIQNPDNGNDEYVVVSAAMGHIWPALNASLPLQQYTEPNLSRDLVPFTAQPLPSGLPYIGSERRIENGELLLNQITYFREIGKNPRNFWIAATCIQSDWPNGYWLRALSGPFKGLEYQSSGPFLPLTNRIVRKILQAGIEVDTTGYKPSLRLLE